VILPDFYLRDKAALVVGDNFLSEALVGALAEAGASVALVGREPRAPAPLIQADVTAEGDVQRALQEALKTLGRIDILINNVQADLRKPLLELTREEWEGVIEANLTSAFLWARAVGGHMIERRRGCIINIASALATAALPNGTAYCTSMGGILGLTRALALEWAPFNVRVNAIGPGWLEGGELGLGEAEREQLVRYIPLRRLGRPWEVAALALYLATDAAAYITGQLFPLDGGLLIRP